MTTGNAETKIYEDVTIQPMKLGFYRFLNDYFWLL